MPKRPHQPLQQHPETEEAIEAATQWGFGLVAHQSLRHKRVPDDLMEIAGEVRRLIIVGQTISLLARERIAPDQEETKELTEYLNHVLGCGVTIYQNPTNVLMSIFARRMLETASYSWERYEVAYSSSRYEGLQRSVGKDYCAFEFRRDKSIPWGGPIVSEPDGEIAKASLGVLRDILLFVLEVYIRPLEEVAPEAAKFLHSHQNDVKV